MNYTRIILLVQKFFVLKIKNIILFLTKVFLDNITYIFVILYKLLPSSFSILCLKKTIKIRKNYIHIIFVMLTKKMFEISDCRSDL